MQTTPQDLPTPAGMADRPTPAAAILHTTPQDLPPLAEFVDLQGLLPAVQHTFPTVDSIRWFVRSHRETLAKAGALIAITGRLRYHPALFQQVAAEIGRAAAAWLEGGTK